MVRVRQAAAFLLEADSAERYPITLRNVRKVTSAGAKAAFQIRAKQWPHEAS
jgi:hypothetical protein